ncbi:MAG: helix-turn-helix transcriptional regulator, partial [Verrucomicrobia bacterium]|nr:helix-turn-helix transcriptional regulator [Verrucomicrobiota bacterium]
MVRRTVFATVPPRVQYEATPLGRSLRGLLEDMCDWSSENVEKIREF